MSSAVWSYTGVGKRNIIYSKLATSKVLDFVFRSLVSTLTVVVAIPLSGWLADQKFGNFKVFRAGCVLMFLGSVLLCLGIQYFQSSPTILSGAQW